MSTSIRILSHMALCWICLSATCSVKMVNTSIPPAVDTYYVKPFGNNAFNAPPNIGNDFSERLKDRIREQSRLDYTDTNPDIEFEGAVQGFDVSYIAPSANETVELNRLRITIKVDCFDNTNKENNWTQNFFFEQDYSANQNLVDVQDELINAIFEQLTTDVFNKAFGKW